MRIGLFGGSFDPPHRGHLAVADAALKRCELDRVLLAPTGRQPLKPAGATASFVDRLAMVRLLCNEDSRLEVSALDGPRPDGGPNYTVDLLERLRREIGEEDTLLVITGADAFLDLRRWRSPERLLQLAEWIAVSRPGIEADGLSALSLTPAEQIRVHWLGDVAEPVSATAVREQMAHGLDCSGLVPGPVLEYINKHGLYRPHFPERPQR